MNVEFRKRRLCLGGLFALFYLTTQGAGGAPVTGRRVIKVTARKFAYSPSEFTIRRGEPVVLEITAIDFTHGFSIPDLKIRTDLVPDKPVRLDMNVGRSGIYDFLCDNFCGAGHEEMNGKLFVVE